MALASPLAQSPSAPVSRIVPARHGDADEVRTYVIASPGATLLQRRTLRQLKAAKTCSRVVTRSARGLHCKKAWLRRLPRPSQDAAKAKTSGRENAALDAHAAT